jgi:glucose/mannose-6-phosphate isomerase
LFDGLFATTTPEDVFRDPFDDESPRTMPLRVVLMRDSEESETETDAGLRRAAEHLAGERGVRTSQVAADNGLPFERLAQLIAFGDFASVYLALGLGIDPSPTRSVLEMKERIESSRRNREG